MKGDYKKAISVMFPDHLHLHLHIHHITTKGTVQN